MIFMREISENSESPQKHKKKSTEFEEVQQIITRFYEEYRTKEKSADLQLVDDILRAKREHEALQKPGDFISILINEGLDKLAAARYKELDQSNPPLEQNIRKLQKTTDPILSTSIKDPEKSKIKRQKSHELPLNKASPEIPPKFRKLVKKYHKETGKKANHGLNFTRKFKKWIKDHPSFSKREKSELIENCTKITETLKKALVDKILNTNLSQKQIMRDFAENSIIRVTRDTIQSLSRNLLPGDAYSTRFPANIDKYSEYEDEAILEKARKTNLSLNQITRELNEVGIKVSLDKVQKTIRENLNEDIYKEKYPISSEKIPDNVKDTIYDLIQNSNLSLQNIADKIAIEMQINVSIGTIQNYSKRILSDVEYKARFPAPQDKYSEQEEIAISDKIWNSNLSLEKIAKEVGEENQIGVSITKVWKVAQSVLPEYMYDERFAVRHGKEIPEKAKEAITNYVQNTNLSLKQIQEKILGTIGVEMSPTTVRNYALNDLPPEKFKERFPASQDKYSEEIKSKIRDQINNTTFTPQEIAEKITREGSEDDGIEVSIHQVRKIAHEVFPSLEEYYQRFPKEFYTDLGNAIHPILESIFKEAIQSKGITVSSEEYLSKEKRIDNLILVDQNYKAIDEHLPSNIKNIAIDYSLNVTQHNFTKKCEKEYQTENILFYFIPISFYKQPSDYIIPNVPFKENIRVLSVKDLLKKFDFDKKHQDLFIKYVHRVLEVKKSRDKEGLKWLMDVSQNLNSLKKGQALITDFLN